MEQDPRLTPLTCVTVVCREFPGIERSEVQELISDFVDASPNWIVSHVRHDAMSVQFLKRIHAFEERDLILCDPAFHEWQFEQAAKEAVKHGNLEVLKWLTTDYFPGGVMTKGMRRTAKMNGHMEVVKWLDERHGL